MDMMQRPSLMKYRNFRYFKLMSLLVASSIIIYAISQPADGEPYGGTILGYVLGTISLAIVLLLTWYGVRKRITPRIPDKRQYNTSSRRAEESTNAPQDGLKKRKGKDRRKRSAKESWFYGGTMQGWLSAHIYMGASLLVLATLHAGFQFGLNIHTLSYVLMMMVIASGFYGTFAYLNYPRLITQNIGDDTLKGLIAKIAELDELARIRALGLPDEINQLVLNARLQTRLGGNILQQLSGGQAHCPTTTAVSQIQKLGEKYIKNDQPKLMRDLYSVMLRKQTLVVQVRNEIMMKARMQIWLYFHAPLTIAMLAALSAHILAIFFYW
jgi:hypothetical protein